TPADNDDGHDRRGCIRCAPSRDATMRGVFREHLLIVRHPLARREAQARLRFSIIGALLAAPPPAGELLMRLRELATKPWRDPLTGLDVRFGVSTLERWYYAARRAGDPLAALTDRLRGRASHLPR